MSARSAAAVAVQEGPRAGTGLLLAVAAAIVCPFDCVLAGMIRAGLGIEAICAYLGLSRAGLDHNLVRLDLPTPHDRPRRRGGRRAWSDDDLRCAIHWRRSGIHPESIGLAFGRSAAAVRSKLHRLGVPAPARKDLHKVDPATLDRTPPAFGFPVPPGEDILAAGLRPCERRDHSLAIVPASIQAASVTKASASTQSPARKSRTAGVPGQRDLTLLRVMPTGKAAPTEDAAHFTARLRHENDIETAPAPAPAAEAGKPDRPQVVGPPELIGRFQVLGKVRRPETNEAYVRWLTLLYLGGMHYKAMGAYLDRSPSAIQAILYRMQVPRDKNRRKFGWTCDLECAVATLDWRDFVLQRCMSNPALADHERPLFWRKKDERGNRKRRFTRLKNKEVGEYFKYKDGNSIEIVTRAQLEAQRRILITGSDVTHPARLHGSVQASLPIQQGACHEQFQLRGHAPVVRPGLPGNPREPMPWAYPRNGSAARAVAGP